MENKKGLIITIVILSILVIGLASFIVYDKKLFQEKKENTKTVIDDVNIDLNALYQIGNTLNYIDNAFNDQNSQYFGYIYNTKKLTVEKMDVGAAIYATIHDELIASNTLQTIPEKRVKNNFEKMFGTSIKYAPVEIKSGEYYKIIYDPINKNYNYIVPVKNNFPTSGYMTKNIKTSLVEDTVVIKRKVFYVEYTIDYNTAIIYKTADKQQKVGEIQLINKELSASEIVSKYGSNLNTYEVTFKQKKEDEYVFSRIEQVK